MGTLIDLREWVTEISDTNQCMDIDLNSQNRMRIEFYTHSFRYSIIAHQRKDSMGYIECTAYFRHLQYGESFPVCLPKGEITRETWDKIKNSIIKLEFNKISDISTISK